jgi:hypothetical protein
MNSLYQNGNAAGAKKSMPGDWFSPGMPDNKARQTHTTGRIAIEPVSDR